MASHAWIMQQMEELLIRLSYDPRYRSPDTTSNAGIQIDQLQYDDLSSFGVTTNHLRSYYRNVERLMQRLISRIFISYEDIEISEPFAEDEIEMARIMGLPNDLVDYLLKNVDKCIKFTPG